MTPEDTSSLPGPEALEIALGIRFLDEDLRETALVHRSYAFENGVDTTNERLEFLGDSVLGLVVTDMAFDAFPDMPEGELAKLRAAIVNEQALADVARSLQLGSMVRLGKGEEQSGGSDKDSILADALEAVFGAVYLDLGLEETRRLIERLFRPLMVAYDEGKGPRDYKTILQEIASRELHTMPVYRLEERGPDHEKEFTATVFLDGERLGVGVGKSKKEAEQRAAREAFDHISERVGA